MKLALQGYGQLVFFTHAQEVIFNTAGDWHFKPLHIFELG
jgi:hypothetical protein